MRMEELSDSRYIKTTDTVEKYLLNLVEQYFTNHNVASVTSREYIIKKAIERMKEELSYDDIGVLSITLPSGERRTGAITITLEDLHGEPLITPKLSAFNVPFGDEQNTACEGNDPRLSDERMPVAHNHTIENIIGLEGKLSTIFGKMERINGLSHEHSNKGILDMLVYTGDKSIIDLTLIDTLEDKVNLIVQQIRTEIADYKNTIDAKIAGVNAEIVVVKSQINDLRDFILQKNQEYLTLANQYTDTEISEQNAYIQQIIGTLMTRDKIQDIIDMAKDTYTLAGTMRFSIASAIDVGGSLKEYTSEKDISSNILSELTARNTSLSNCQIEALIEYQSGGQTVFAPLPYITFKDNSNDGAIQVSTVSANNKIIFKLTTAAGVIAPEIQSAFIIYNVYSKEEIAI